MAKGAADAGGQGAEGGISAETAGGVGGGSKEKNPIMQLNEIGMARQLAIEWSLVSESGPPHHRFYSWSLTMGEYQAVGSAQNKKVSYELLFSDLYYST